MRNGLQYLSPARIAKLLDVLQLVRASSVTLGNGDEVTRLDLSEALREIAQPGAYALPVSRWDAATEAAAAVEDVVRTHNAKVAGRVTRTPGGNPFPVDARDVHAADRADLAARSGYPRHVMTGEEKYAARLAALYSAGCEVSDLDAARRDIVEDR